MSCCCPSIRISIFPQTYPRARSGRDKHRNQLTATISSVSGAALAIGILMETDKPLLEASG